MSQIKKGSLVFILLLGAALAVAGAVNAQLNKNKNAVSVLPQIAETKAEENKSAPEKVATSNSVIPVAAAATVASKPVDPSSPYPIHKDISTTYFWAGEEADADNKNISNLPSAWDDQWVKHFGGVDDPKKRNGFLPSSFTPKENPFYFALPYNDFDSNGNEKGNAYTLASWTNGKKPSANVSVCKNQWIKITKSGKSVYAQWEDVGPFGEDDTAYVFGKAAPSSKENDHAGLDVSPAVHDFLGLGDMNRTDWQFVDASQVPDGPWKNIVTTSQIFWP